MRKHRTGRWQVFLTTPLPSSTPRSEPYVSRGKLRMLVAHALARAKVYRKTHPKSEQTKTNAAAHRKAHPEAGRASVLRRRARQRGAFIENVTVEQLAERDHDRCGICRKHVSVAERSVDHILPLSRGGAHSYANTQLAHGRCNQRRSNRGVAQLRMVG